MPLKIVIAEPTGKAWKLELSEEALAGKNIGELLQGKELKPELEGYEFEITGGSDIAGFPLSKDIEGIGLKRVLLAKGWGMRDNYPGIRRRKTVRGKQISSTTIQVNMNVVKAGPKLLAEIFPEQNKPQEKNPAGEKEKKAEAAPEQKKETPTQPAQAAAA